MKRIPDIMYPSRPCLFLLLSALSVVFAAPEVKIGKTTLVGKDISSSQQEFFGGIPFAEPPVGLLRFKPPLFKDTYDEETLNVTQFGFPCLQFNTTLQQASEDCLTLNIFRPAGLPPNAALPVLFWLYGGGFDRGTSVADASPIVARSVQRGTPVVFVSINYRLGPLGFPQGKEAEQKGLLNLALKDELTALEWVHKHIGKFGGDKNKVTVAGVSAGAIMNAILFLHPSTKRLVRGGIFQSGSAATTITHTAPFRQHSWDQFVSSVPACADLAGTDHTVDCLLEANVTDILEGLNSSRENAVEGFPWDPTLDGPGGLYPDYPSVMFKLGQFARIPFISGTNLDEGTVLVDPTQNYTTDLVRDNLFTNFSTPFLETFEQNKLNRAVERTLELYPDDPSLGSPFGTGNNAFGLSPGFKRISAITGDVSFLSQRRVWQQTMANDPSGVKSYGYLWKQGTLATRLFPQFGVLHGSDSHYFFNDTLVDTVTPGALEVGVTLMDYFLSFVDSLDPNDGKGIQRPQWNAYSKQEQRIMQMQALNVTLIPDNFRKEQTDFFNSLPDIFHH